MNTTPRYLEPSELRRKIDEHKAEIQKFQKLIDAHQTMVRHYQAQLARQQRTGRESAGSDRPRRLEYADPDWRRLERRER